MAVGLYAGFAELYLVAMWLASILILAWAIFYA